MTHEQVKLVQRTYESVRAVSAGAVTLFWRCLFDLNPGLDDVFSGDIGEESRKLMQILSVVVRSLDHDERLRTAAKAVREYLEAYGIEDFDYRTMGQALLWTLERTLGPSFTPEAKGAWTEAYTLFSRLIRNSADPLQNCAHVAT